MSMHLLNINRIMITYTIYYGISSILCKISTFMGDVSSFIISDILVKCNILGIKCDRTDMYAHYMSRTLVEMFMSQYIKLILCKARLNRYRSGS